MTRRMAPACAALVAFALFASGAPSHSAAWLGHPADDLPMCVVAAPGAAESGSANLLVNGGFEAGVYAPDLSPESWSRVTALPSGVLTWDADQAYEGSRCVEISAATPNDACWTQRVTVVPGTNYLLSGWIRTRDVGHTPDTFDIGANLCLLGTWEHHSPGLFGTNDWTYSALAFNSGDLTEVTVAARLGYWSGISSGTAWFDDLQLTPISAEGPHPGWKILVLIYGRLDFECTDGSGNPHHFVANVAADELERAAASARAFVEVDVPILTSGNMVPTVTIHYPERTLTTLTPFHEGWWASMADTDPEWDREFDSVIVLWPAWVVDQLTGRTEFIGGSAGATPALSTWPTYCAIVMDATTSYGHRNVLKHEWGHSILSYYEAIGTAPRPTVNNHIDMDGTTDVHYVHWPTGEAYVLKDETEQNPIPNSIYNNESGFTHDYYSGTTATPDQTNRRLGITPEAWATGGPVSKPARFEPAPDQQVEAIVVHLDRLVAAAVLTAAQGRNLRTKLLAAIDALHADRVGKAIADLAAFVDRVGRLVRQGRLPSDEGAGLVADAEAVITRLSAPAGAVAARTCAREAGETEGSGAAAEFALWGIQPNPLREHAVIEYALPDASPVELQVFDVSGRLRRTLDAGERSAGVHRLRFDREGLPAGLYFCRLRAGGQVAARRLVIAR